MNEIIKHSEKIKRKEAYQLAENAIRLDSLLMNHKIWRNFIDSELFWSSDDFIKKLGKPLATLPDFESNPGIWVFTDSLTSFTFLIYSDCYKKNYYKGTSYEFVRTSPELFNVKELAEAFQRLIEYLLKLK